VSKMLEKKSKNVTCNYIFYDFPLTKHLRKPAKFPQNLENLYVNFREIWHVFKKVP